MTILRLIWIAAFVFLPVKILAQTLENKVELRAVDGSAVIRGRLIERTDSAYVIKTKLGLFRFEIASVNCIGAACEGLTKLQATPNDPTILDMTAEKLKSELPKTAQTAKFPIVTRKGCAGDDVAKYRIDDAGGVVDFDSDYSADRYISAAEFAQQPAQILRFAETISGARRLSFSFRFAASDGQLDNAGLLDLDKLAAQISTESQLLILGFADSSGGYDANLQLSKKRAEAIARALQSRGLGPDLVTGFGEEAPIACNETAQGRAYNRRVEIWVR